MREDIEIRNYAATSVECAVTLRVDADFADLFEVKEGRAAHPPGEVALTDAAGSISLARDRGERTQSVIVGSLLAPDIDGSTLRWTPAIEPRRAAPERGRPRVVAHVRPGQPRLSCGGRRRALVHGAVRAGLNEVFGLPDRGWYALGLDADKKLIDALASNMGHCLWTGIVDDDKAAEVARHLLSPEMFSGWGIRTLATSINARLSGGDAPAPPVPRRRPPGSR